MSIKDDLAAKIAADREAGRDVPPVIEELFLLIGEQIDGAPAKTEQPVAPAAADPASQAPEQPITQ